MKLTITQMTRVFNTTNMTIYNWRKGTVTRRPLPTVADPKATKATVLFDSKEVLRWAKEYGVPVVVEPGKLGEALPVATPTRGPKAMPKKAASPISKAGKKVAKVEAPAKEAAPAAKSPRVAKKVAAKKAAK